MQNKKQTVFERYNNTLRFLKTLNYEQLEMLVSALNEKNQLQVTQTQIDSACNENDEQYIKKQIDSEVYAFFAQAAENVK